MKQRESNMELLRIISILMIIIFHCAFKSGFSFAPGFSVNKLVVKTFWMLGELGVNLFMLISGYFMVNGRFKWRKLVRLLAEVQFYTWGAVWLGGRLGVYALSGWKQVLFTFFPVTTNFYWFITAYILVYIMSPYLNLLIRAMDEKTHRNLLITALALYCLIPTVFGFFYNNTEGMLYYNRFIWLIIMYFLGAYISRKNCSREIPEEQQRKRSARISVISAAVLVLSILVIDHFHGFFEWLGTTEPAYFWPPNTIPMVFLSVGLFTLFLHIKIPYNPAINAAASTTLGIYLLHDGILVSWLWRTVFQCAAYQDSPLLPVRILTAAGVIFTVGAAIDLLRQKLEKHTLDRLLDSGLFRRREQNIQLTNEKTEERLFKMSLKNILNARPAKALKWCAWLLFAASFALLSFYHIIYYKKWVIYCTVIGSGLIGFFWIQKTGDAFISYIRTRRFQSAVYCLLAMAVLVATHRDIDYLYTNVVMYPLPFLPVRFFRFRWMILTFPALFYLTVWVSKAVTGFISDFWAGLNSFDRRLYLGLTLAASAIILTAYIVQPLWFLQDDRVYSLDSGWCYRGICSRLSYYDIRHPVLSIITFPIWAILHTVLQWLVPSQLLDVFCASCLQIINVQMLLLTGFMVQKLSKNRWTLPLYLVSFSTLLFTMFFEKYQLAVFLLVLYAYDLCYGNERARGVFVLAAGAMPTNAFLYAGEMLSGKPAAHKAKSLFKTFLTGTAFLICSGRVHLLLPSTLWQEVSYMANSGYSNTPVVNLFFSLTNMVHGAFLSSSSVFAPNYIQQTSYIWADILNAPSVIGLVLLAVIVLGILTNFKDPFIKLCSIWAGVSVLLFCVFQWSVHESPLFSIYFTWALVSLFQKGFQFLIEKFHWKERIAYCALLFPMLVINIVTLIDIGKFLETI